MSLAALIAAYHESADPGDGLRATLPLAGSTLVERQARLAAAAGAKPVILVVERQPPEFAAAVARLRSEGLDIVVARSALEAARVVQASDRLLLIADGLIADDAEVKRLIEAEGTVLLTVPDIRFDDRFERIDAESRWAGLAIIDGQLLKHTAAMLQDWDLQSTLLRRAVQNGARQVGLGGDPAKTRMIAAERASDLADLQSRILESASTYQGDWVSRYLLSPLELLLTRRLMPTPVRPGQLWLGVLALGALSAFCLSRGWLWPGLLLFLVGTPLAGVAERLGRLRAHAPGPPGWLAGLAPMLAAAALLALGWSLSLVGGWGCLVLAGVILLFQLALETELEGRPVPGSVFLAEPKGMAWLMLPFAGTGQWMIGLGALALYAAGSFFWAQRQVHGRVAAPEQD